MSTYRSLFPLIAFVALALLPRSANAQQASDGMYGRFSGDLGLQLDVGTALAGGKPALLVQSTLRYLQTAGLYASYAEDFRNEIGPASRSFALGVEMRPLFLPRVNYDWQKGPAILDLFVDSLALRLGAVVSRQKGFELAAPGFEAALAFGLPLTSCASGPWLGASAGLRLSDHQLASRQGSHLDRATFFALTLGWQHLFPSHIIDAGDGLAR